jgi:GTP-binding protein HflX
MLHVMDASADDLEAREAAVVQVLKQIGAAERPCLEVLNKRDRLAPERRVGLAQARPEAILVGALAGEGLDELLSAVARRLDLVPRSVLLRFRRADSAAIAGVYKAGRVVSHEVSGDEVEIAAEIPERLVARYREHIV